MNKSILIAVLVAIMIATGAFVFINRDEDITEQASQQSSQSTLEAENKSTEQTPTTQSENSGSYVAYSDDVIAQAADTERVLFFHAEWCSVCNFYEGQIEKNGVPEGITVIKADYDTEDALKDQYGVTVQSTFIWLDENGEARQSWPFANGLQSADDLFAIVQAG